jgi:transcriptional regulator with XRE-family HTH domain
MGPTDRHGDAENDASAAYASALGDRLRNVRQQQGLSLHDVEERSGGQLKASVVGAYERGERAVSVTRLRTLADFYRVPVAQLLPGREEQPADERARAGLVIDLVALGTSPAAAFAVDVVERYVEAIKVRRGDYNGRMLTVRSADVAALAAVLDRAPDALRDELVGAGVARTPVG